MSSPTRAIISSAAWFGVLSLLPKVFSLLKDIAVAASFGASKALDTYLISFILIGIPVSIIIVAIQTTLIPALVNKDISTAANLLGGTIKRAVELLIFALPIWLAILPAVLDMLYPSKMEIRDDLLSSCLWLIPYYFTNGINHLLYGSLQAYKVFWPNAVLPGLLPLALIIAIWLMPVADIRPLLLGTVFGSAMEGVALIFVLRRKQLLRPLHSKAPKLMSILRPALPLMVGGIMTSFAPVVEQLIALRLGPGAVSILSYGNKVPAALNSLLLTAVGIVVLPYFADLLAKREWQLCKRVYFRLSLSSLIIGIMVAVVGIAFSKTIVQLLFERGAFTARDTREVADVMCAYLFQLPFLLVSMVSVRALIAMEKTLVMSVVTACQLILAGTLAYYLSFLYGTLGVAGGTATAALFGTSILVITAWHGFHKQYRDYA